MPPGPTAPCSLAGLLAEFRPCFTAPTFHTFVGLVVGLIAQTRRRTVCGMLTGAGLDQVWHHSRAHRLFTNARWSGDALGLDWPWPPSSRGEFHPPALTDPYVNLSVHTALVVLVTRLWGRSCSRPSARSTVVVL